MRFQNVALKSASEIWFAASGVGNNCAIGKPGVIDVIDIYKMTLVEEIPTEEGAHTFAFDNAHQRLYAFLPLSCRAAVYKETWYFGFRKYKTNNEESFLLLLSHLQNNCYLQCH